MRKIKVICKNFLYSIIFLLVSTMIIALLSFFNILNGKSLAIFQILACFSTIIIGSYKQGKCSIKKGYLEGLKIGIIYLLIFSIINAFIYHSFHLKNYIYYLLILIVSSLGGMIGISKKK